MLLLLFSSLLVVVVLVSVGCSSVLSGKSNSGSRVHDERRMCSLRNSIATCRRDDFVRRYNNTKARCNCCVLTGKNSHLRTFATAVLDGARGDPFCYCYCSKSFLLPLFLFRTHSAPSVAIAAGHQLSQLFKSSASLHTVLAGGNYLGDRGVAALCGAFCYLNPARVVSLDVSGNGERAATKAVPQCRLQHSGFVLFVSLTVVLIVIVCYRFQAAD